MLRFVVWLSLVSLAAVTVEQATMVPVEQSIRFTCYRRDLDGIEGRRDMYIFSDAPRA